MSYDRRTFMLSSAAMAAAGSWFLSACAGQGRDADVDQHVVAAPDLELGPQMRAEFPRVAEQIYLNSAAQHPLGLSTLRAMERHLHYQTYGAGDGRGYFSRAEQLALKAEFATLIKAHPEEIAFTQSTSDGENIVVSGMDLMRRGGNVVVDDLHFTSSLFLYKMLEEHGLELRVARERDGAIQLDEMKALIDRDTRLVSLALVSNINGHLHDVAAVSEIAHAHDAYVYADIIQAAGAVPLDMVAMGIDFAAAATYKWLMAERGFGMLFVRRDLQDTVVPTTRWGHRQVRGFDRRDFTCERLPGASRYETGNISEPLAAAALASVRFINRLGVEKIAQHRAPLIAALQTELPVLGYDALTPSATPTPIAAFRIDDPEDVMRRLEAADIAATVSASDRRLRVSVSVFNTQDDIDRLVGALA